MAIVGKGHTIVRFGGPLEKGNRDRLVYRTTSDFPSRTPFSFKAHPRVDQFSPSYNVHHLLAGSFLVRLGDQMGLPLNAQLNAANNCERWTLFVLTLFPCDLRGESQCLHGLNRSLNLIIDAVSHVRATPRHLLTKSMQTHSPRYENILMARCEQPAETRAERRSLRQRLTTRPELR